MDRRLIPVFRHDLGAAQARYDSMLTWVRSPGGQVRTPAGEVRVAVRGEGYPVLVLHGAAGGFDRAVALGERDLGTGYQIIAPSRYGYPGSPIPPAATPLSQATALVGVLDHLGLDRVAVIAHSAGGPSAVQLALLVPDLVSALILVATTVTERRLRYPSRPLLGAILSSELLFWYLMRPQGSGRELFVPRHTELSTFQTTELAETMSSCLPARLRRAGILFDMYVTNPDPVLHPGAYDLEALRVPSLFLNAKDDPLIDYAQARSTARRAPRGHFVTIPSGGHAMLGQGGLLQAEIDRFIAACA